MSEETRIGAAEFSAKTGLSKRQARRVIKKLPTAWKEGRSYYVDPASLDEFLKSSKKPLPAEEIFDNPKPESLSHPVSDTYVPDADIQTLSTDTKRTSDILEDIGKDTPTDIAALSLQLRSSIEAVRTSHEAMSDTADLLFHSLAFECHRNRDVEARLQEMIAELNIQPAIHSQRQKALRQFKTFLPWLLFGISTCATLLLWF